MLAATLSLRRSQQATAAPWADDGSRCLRMAQLNIPCDAILIGVFGKGDAQPDELLACEGFPINRVRSWIGSGPEADTLVGARLCNATSPGRSDLPGWIDSYHAIMAALPDPFPSVHQWFLAIGRRRRLFNEAEQSTGALLLRRWQHRFLFPRQTKLGRLLVGNDLRLLASDVATREIMGSHPAFISALTRTLRISIAQRFPPLRHNETSDFVIELAGQAQWVRVQRRTAIKTTAGRYWYIEIRPVDDEELPPTGAVGDERVAHALARMHNEYSKDPSLASIAREVGMSPFQFQRVFSHSIGISPKQYLLRWRLVVAKWLLRDPAVPIGTIASHTGFSSHWHFTATFSRVAGATPRDYREESLLE